ncbi:MAG: hypothetical protein LBR53_05165 [Deltaproteobacteria bacterium]|nr:hypothetical protein [Deltaproteobacteria bacterium]
MDDKQETRTLSFDLALKYGRFNYKRGRCEGFDDGRNEGWRRGWKEGREDGFREGTLEGLVNGFEKGWELGRKDGDLEARRKIARKMSANEPPLDVTVELSGLSEEEVRALKDVRAD